MAVVCWEWNKNWWSCPSHALPPFLCPWLPTWHVWFHPSHVRFFIWTRLKRWLAHCVHHALIKTKLFQIFANNVLTTTQNLEKLKSKLPNMRTEKVTFKNLQQHFWTSCSNQHNSMHRVCQILQKKKGTFFQILFFFFCWQKIKQKLRIPHRLDSPVPVFFVARRKKQTFQSVCVLFAQLCAKTILCRLKKTTKSCCNVSLFYLFCFGRIRFEKGPFAFSSSQFWKKQKIWLSLKICFLCGTRTFKLAGLIFLD